MSKYKAFSASADLGPDDALLQAASALDAAGTEADKKGDVDALLNVSAMWIKLSEAILEYSKAVESAEPGGSLVKSQSGRLETGFQRSVQKDDIIVEEEENV